MLGRLILILAYLGLLMPSAAIAQGTRPEGAIGASASEKRWYENRIAALERTSGLQATTIAGIARVLEMDNPRLSPGDLLQRLDQHVKLAAQLEKRIDSLETEIANLRGASRDQAGALLEQARTAFAAADFPAAETQFGELAALLAEREDADAAMLTDTTLARALSAELEGTEDGYDRARGYRLAARGHEQERRKRSLLAEWHYCSEQVSADLRRVRTRGTVGILAQTEALAGECLAVLRDPGTDPLRWGQSHGLIGQVAAERAQTARGDTALPFFDMAAEAFQTALAGIDGAQHPFERAEALRWSATMLVQQAFRRDASRGLALLDLADQRLAEAGQLYRQSGRSAEAALAASDAAVATHVRSQFLTGERRIDSLRAFIAQSAAARAMIDDDAPPELRANMHGNQCTGQLDLAMLGAQAGWDRAIVAGHLDTALAQCDVALAMQEAETYPLPHASLRIIRAQANFALASLLPDRCVTHLAAAADDTRTALAMFERTEPDGAMADYARTVAGPITAHQCTLPVGARSSGPVDLSEAARRAPIALSRVASGPGGDHLGIAPPGHPAPPLTHANISGTQPSHEPHHHFRARCARA